MESPEHTGTHRHTCTHTDTHTYTHLCIYTEAVVLKVNRAYRKVPPVKHLSFPFIEFPAVNCCSGSPLCSSLQPTHMHAHARTHAVVALSHSLFALSLGVFLPSTISLNDSIVSFMIALFVLEGCVYERVGRVYGYN